MTPKTDQNTRTNYYVDLILRKYIISQNKGSQLLSYDTENAFWCTFGGRGYDKPEIGNFLVKGDKITNTYNSVKSLRPPPAFRFGVNIFNFSCWLLIKEQLYSILLQIF